MYEVENLNGNVEKVRNYFAVFRATIQKVNCWPENFDRVEELQLYVDDCQEATDFLK